MLMICRKKVNREAAPADVNSCCGVNANDEFELNGGYSLVQNLQTSVYIYMID